MPNIPKKSLGWILIGIAVIAGLWLLLGGRSGNTSTPQTIPQTGGSNTGSSIGLGQLYVASQIDQSGCPVQESMQFASNQTIYAGVTQSSIPQGTQMFMRLYYEGQPIEDSQPITANQNQQGCIWFAFQPTGQGFQQGNYTVELMVNGNSANRASFSVGSTSGSSGGLSGQTSNVQLGTMYTTTAVDRNGCPTDDVAEFYTNEPVYVSFQQSYIPAGTEMFARLVYQGQPLEDTQPITANQDMQSCIWFVFQPSAQSSGFQPGNYTAEVYVNGQLADSLQFDVR